MTATVFLHPRLRVADLPGTARQVRTIDANGIQHTRAIMRESAEAAFVRRVADRLPEIFSTHNPNDQDGGDAA